MIIELLKEAHDMYEKIQDIKPLDELNDKELFIRAVKDIPYDYFSRSDDRYAQLFDEFMERLKTITYETRQSMEQYE